MRTHTRIQNLFGALFITCLVSIIVNIFSDELFNFDVQTVLNKFRFNSKSFYEYEGTKYYHQQSHIDTDFFYNPPNVTKDERLNQFRAGEVKKAFIHAWSAYKKFAWGNDNVAPISSRASNSWQGWGITLVDSLDLLILMGLNEEYEQALKQVEKIDFSSAKSSVMVFETIIRYLGGLLGANDLRPDPILLKQAQILAEALLPAFKTPSGLPAHKVNFKTGVLQGMGGTNDIKVNLAEIGTLQLEFHRLSQLTNNNTYSTVAQKIIDKLENTTYSKEGLYPLVLDMSDLSSVSDAISFGAMGDSFYEYLLKRYLLTNQTEEQYKRMYERSIDSLHKYLIEQRDDTYDNLMLLTERSVSGQVVYKMDHLACFVPGMLALGGIALNRKKDLLVSQELVHSCRHFYEMTLTGLGPESVGWTPTPEEKRLRSGDSHSPREFSGTIPPTPYKDGFHLLDARYLLRPETLESIFYSYRLTGDPIYQDWAWEIFQAIQKHCRVSGGFAEYADVRAVPGFNKPDLHIDNMESFFFAETLKYLFLIFMPPNHLDLQEFVLTTEAHPLRISRD